MKDAFNLEIGDDVIYYLNKTRIRLYVTDGYCGEAKLGIHNSDGDKDYFYIMETGRLVQK